VILSRRRFSVCRFTLGESGMDDGPTITVLLADPG
jgi:hypothetical protein